MPWTVLALALLAGLAAAHDAGPPSTDVETAERLTRELTALAARFDTAPPASRGDVLAELVRVAAARKRVLRALVESAPGTVLRVSLPPALRRSLPEAARNLLEEAIDVEGALEVLHEDRDTGSRYLHFLETGTERLALHFPGEPPALLTGLRVRVRGVRIDAVVAVREITGVP